VLFGDAVLHEPVGIGALEGAAGVPLQPCED
jgi:hypothetical protein